MCYQFIIKYQACEHRGQPEYRPCGSPNCKRVIPLVTHDDLMDFCPECFLMDVADFRQYVERPYTYEVYRTMRITCRWPSAQNRAREIHARAAKYHEVASGANEMLALVPPDGTKLDVVRHLVVRRMLRMVLRDFWTRIKYDVSPQPTVAQRMLILQLNKIRDLAAIEWGLEELRRRADRINSLTIAVPEDEVAENDNCPICHEPFGTENEDGEMEHCVKTIPCNHMFGNLCLVKWLSKSDNEWSCPICRDPLTPTAQPQELVQEEVAAQDNRIVRFRNWHGKVMRMDRANIPDWMIALLDATDVVERNVDADDEDEEDDDEEDDGYASDYQENTRRDTRMRHLIVDMERRLGEHLEFEFPPPPSIWTRFVTRFFTQDVDINARLRNIIVDMERMLDEDFEDEFRPRAPPSILRRVLNLPPTRLLDAFR